MQHMHNGQLTQGMCESLIIVGSAHTCTPTHTQKIFCIVYFSSGQAVNEEFLTTKNSDLRYIAMGYGKEY